MSQMPRDRAPEAAPALLREGYRYIDRRCRRYGSDAFRTRLMLQSTVCMRGPAAARLFYDGDRFVRHGAAPRRVRKTLSGQGGVQSLDGPDHYRRKQLFLSLMTPARIDELTDEIDRQWQTAAREWQGRDRVVLLDASRILLSRGVCRWAGIELAEREVERRTRELASMVDASGAIGPAHWAGRRARQRAERWAAGIIRATRTGEDGVARGSPADAVAWHTDRDGAWLDERLAGVELLNLLRPTVALSRYFVFLAHALHEHPEYLTALREDRDGVRTCFVHEVRRLYPFFPFAAARARQDFDWYGYRFRSGERVLLDLYGTNHDARAWPDPESFRPERFRTWSGSAFDFVAQGGGDHALGHRCAGEWISIALMQRAVEQLTERLDYRVPSQDLRIDLSHIPAQPRSGFVVDRVRPQ